MYQMMNMSIIIFMLSFMIMMLATILSKKTQNDREKLTPFECGFDPFIKSRLPFSLHFFLITLIFLIFDVEIALLLPMIMIINYSNLMMWLINSSLFIYILIIGLYYEWNKGMLTWL